MVMVQNDSDSSESDSGRHDRFRSERVIAPSIEERKRSPRERYDRERERDRDREREREREREKERDRRRRSRERSRERSRRRREEVGERYFGPALPPPHLQHSIDRSPDDEEDSSTRYSYGPALPPSPPSPPGEAVGPHLPGDTSAAATALEQRARSLRKQLENKAERERSTSRGRSRREEWMTSLPEERRGVPPGTTGARKFRTSEVPQMSSEWTMTPAEKARQTESGSGDWERSENERRREAKERKEMGEEEERRARKEKKRAKSLLEQHQKALKKKKKKEKKEREERNGSKREERRPFDRNIDLDCSRLDAAQRRSVINKAALLDSRFSYGEAKYL